MPGAKKEKKGTAARERRVTAREASTARRRKKLGLDQDDDVDFRKFEEFKNSGGAMFSGGGSERAASKAAPPPPQPPSRRCTMFCGIVQRVSMLVFLMVVLSRQDFFTAFGVGTGVSKAHVSPMSVVVRASQHDAIQSNHKLKTASKKAILALAAAGELLNEHVVDPLFAKESVLKKKKKKRRSRRNKNGDCWIRAQKWVRRVHKDKGLKMLVDDNHFMGAGGALTILGAFLGALAPGASIVTLVGMGTMFVRAKGSLKPEFNMYIFLGVLLVGYSAGQYLAEDTPKKRRRGKKKKNEKKRRTRDADSKEDDEVKRSE